MQQQISAPGHLTRRGTLGGLSLWYAGGASSLGWRGHEQQPSRCKIKCIKQSKSQGKYGVQSPAHTEPATLLPGVNVLKLLLLQGMDGGQGNAEGQQQASRLLS